MTDALYTSSIPLACRVLEHRFRFRADGEVMRWRCERCGAGGEKTYASAEAAASFAASFDREDRRDIGKRAPLVGLLPLRIASLFRRRGKDLEQPGVEEPPRL